MHEFFLKTLSWRRSLSYRNQSIDLRNTSLQKEKFNHTIFFEQRIKEKFNTRFDYSFWECCLLYFVVACFAVDIMSSEMLNLVPDSPSIASLQVMILAKDSSRSKFGLKQVLFFLTSEKTRSSSALECGITRINFTNLVSLANLWHSVQSFKVLR